MLLFVLLLAFIAIAAGLAWFFISHDRGAKEPVIALWAAVAFGMAGAFMASWLESRFVNADYLLPGMPMNSIMYTAMTIGVIEEICKFLPLAVYIYKRPFFNEHTDGIIYFALAGLGFGLPENILYTVQFGTSAGIVRILMTPIFHAAATGMIGYFLARRKLAGKPVLGVALPLIAASILHGLYNFGLSTGMAIYAAMALSITLSLSAGLFLLWLRASQRDQDMGRSSMGHNSFCRSCGLPNAHHYLYCVHCGKNA